MHSDRWFAALEDRPAYLATKVRCLTRADGLWDAGWQEEGLTPLVPPKTWLAKYSSGIGWLPKEPNVGLVTSRGASGLVTKLYQKHRGNRRVRVYTMHSAVGSGSRKLLQEFRRRLQCSKKNYTNYMKKAPDAELVKEAAVLNGSAELLASSG